jgi:hypothetical protein
MNTVKIFSMTIFLAVAMVSGLIESCRTPRKTISKLEVIRRIYLPKPILKGSVSVEEAMVGRRSRRDYSNKALQLSEISQLLWAAQGITRNSFPISKPRPLLLPVITTVFEVQEKITIKKKACNHLIYKPLCIPAEREGFEPPNLLQLTVFKTAAFDRSAISPWTKL